MAKPAITKRTTKGAALTYSELDTNFQNLADATLTLTADTSGTAVTADLNGNITLVAGTGITLTGDNTAKTVTITGTPSVTGLTNPLNADLDLGSYNIIDSSGVATVSSAALKIQTIAGTDSIQIAPNSSGLYTIDLVTDKDLTIRTFESNTVTSRITLDHDTGVDIGTGAKTKAVSIADGLFRIIGMTTTQRNTITAAAGMLIFNTTDSKFQGHDGTSWVDLH